MKEIYIEKKKSVSWIFIFSLIAFFIFNFLTTFWVEKASAEFGEGLVAVLLNSLFMAITFLIYSFLYRLVLNYFSKNRFRVKFLGLFILSLCWIGFELLHMNWDLNWPWLTLGNVFANHPSWVQWYSYTGVLGGTIWILVLNYMFFQTYLNFPYKNKLNFRNHFFYLILFLFPFSLSKIMYYAFQYHGNEGHVLVAQPNIDPNGNNHRDYERYFMNLINDNQTDTVNYIVFPESFFPNQHHSNFISDLLDQNNYRFTNFIFGTQVHRDDKIYNTAVQLNLNNKGNKQRAYHYKSKLVPGPELTPFSSSLQPFLDFTGLSLQLGGLDKGDTINVFYSTDSVYCVAPIICYESVFPNHVRKFIKKGAQAIFVITNDGWWGNSQGRKQHNAYARIRAIETRRYVVRSANTGISSVINPKGDFEHMLDSNMEGSFVKKITFLTNKTFYVKYGNLLIFCYLASFIFFVPKLGLKYIKN